MIDFLFKWQDLSGAIIGGLTGLFAALLVSYQSKLSEQRSAATLLIIDLISLSVSIRRTEDLILESGLNDEESKNAFFADKIIIIKPQLSPLFEASMLRVLTLDKYLAAHLTLLNALFRDANQVMTRLEKDAYLANKGDELDRPLEQSISDCLLIRECMHRIKGQAEAAHLFLEKISLSNFPTFYKIRRRYFPTQLERIYYEQLQTGKPIKV